ncbi:phage gp6-like head-tail connector protein [Clostridium aceticum]|uniref:Phage gp6-like head-tail connector protein n=1 Tax=Clostridium aceticum TaxID=84022 RepID=A0A0G3WDZ5_9CLOT|nr:head-tail connector protein [Clostridium aceticum]AKL96137.1 phage gp6-like head-tail connector protein [Clostridium aceticum]
MLELMKTLLSIRIDETSKDTLLEHFLSKAQIIIKGYCNISNIPEKYNHVIVDYAIYLYKNKDSEGYKEKSEGERKVKYDGAIPESIRFALPLPKIKVGGY